MRAELGLIRIDGGSLIYRARLAADPKSLTGVVELFLDLTDLAVIGRDDGFETLNP